MDSFFFFFFSFPSLAHGNGQDERSNKGKDATRGPHADHEEFESFPTEDRATPKDTTLQDQRKTNAAPTKSTSRHPYQTIAARSGTTSKEEHRRKQRDATG